MLGFLRACLEFLNKHSFKTNIFLSVITLGLSIKCFRMAKKASKLENRNIKNNVIELIGNTPLIYLESLSKLTKSHIYVKYIYTTHFTYKFFELLKGKCEFLNPGGSIKDRTALSIIKEAKRFIILRNLSSN